MSIYPTAASHQLQVAGTKDPVHLCHGMQLSLMGDLEEEVEIYAAWGVIQGLLHANGDHVVPSSIARKCQQDGISYPFCFCAWNVFTTDEECRAVLGTVTVNSVRHFCFKCPRLNRVSGCMYIAVLLENHQFQTMTRTYGSALNLPMADPIYQSPDKHMKCSFIISLSRAPSHLLHINLFVVGVNYGSSPAWISRSIDDVFDIETNHNRFLHRLLAPFDLDVGTSDDHVFCSWDSPQGASGAVFLYALGLNIVCPHCNRNFSGLYNYDQHTCHNGGQGLQLPENIEEVGNTADGNGDDDSEGHMCAMKTNQTVPAAPHRPTLAAALKRESSSSQPQVMASPVRWHVNSHQSIVTHTNLAHDPTHPPSVKQFAINSGQPPKRTKCHTPCPETCPPPVQMPRHQGASSFMQAFINRIPDLLDGMFEHDAPMPQLFTCRCGE
ncbi:hypothetical protein JB92DRAFT_2831027 [Gautieria morchelliformis]|nr:hypothetical protein JB92DRAFT_2831027 [Gautieria morchelliformis]